MQPSRALGAVLAGVLALGHARGVAASPAPHEVSPAERGQLQAMLDRYGSVRLASNADYGGPALRMASGQRLEAGWNTRLPRIEIPGGVSDVSLSGIRGSGGAGADVVFTEGAEARDVRIIGASAGPGSHPHVLIGDGARVLRLTVSELGGLEVRQARAGYVRDSTFTALDGYWPGPQVEWRGNDAEPSTGNAFLGVWSITPQRGGRWQKAGDLWFIGWGCETWNSKGDGWPRCFDVEDSPRVISIGLSGGTAVQRRAGALASFRRVGALVTWFDDAHGGRLDAADVRLESVGAALAVQRRDTVRVLDTPADATERRVLLPVVGGNRASLAADSALVAALGQPLPVLGAKPLWRGGAPRVSVPDSSPAAEDAAPAIQARIDATGVAVVAPGRYRIGRPLRIGSAARVEGLMAAGAGRVELVASGDFPLITGRGGFGAPRGLPRSGMVTLVLRGLRLTGGSEGIRWSGEADNLGPGGTIAFSTFEDLELVGQRRAAIAVEGIFGLDNNFWHRVDISRVPVAFLGSGRGGDLGMNYADKQLFLDCQFTDVAGAIWQWESDRPSGGEIWRDVYARRIGQLSRTRSATNLLWINSVFEDVTGARAIEVTDHGTTETGYFYLLGCLFAGLGPGVVTDTQSGRIGTLFVGTEFAQHGGRIVAASGGQGLSSWSSRVTGSAVLGPVDRGVFIRSRLGRYEGALEVVEDGKAATLYPAQAPPDPGAH